MNSGHLQTGGLIYPNTDGSGPQADSLAAAIYGVAVPPGFNQFSASENYYGQNRGDAFSDSFGGGGINDAIRPSDLLLATGTVSFALCKAESRANSLKFVVTCTQEYIRAEAAKEEAIQRISQIFRRLVILGPIRAMTKNHRLLV